MLRKKIYQSQRDGDDDCGPSGPCFQVSPDVQLKEHPSNGEEFLYKVMLERKNIPALVEYKDYDREESVKHQTPNMEQIPIAKAPDKLKPTIEWQNIQVADFSESRMYVSRMRSHPNAKVVPFQYDHSYKGLDILFKSHEPALSRVIGLKTKIIDDGLQTLLLYLTHVKHGDTIEHVKGQWLYTFMACIKLPVLPVTHGLLRDIARQCAEIRSHIDPERDNAARLATPLNLFICLVGRYFRQYDLAD